MMAVVGCWLLVVGCCWLLVVGCWLLVVGCWLLVVVALCYPITIYRASMLDLDLANVNIYCGFLTVIIHDHGPPCACDTLDDSILLLGCPRKLANR